MGEIATALDDRSFGAFLLVFAIPNLIPLPPGATMVLGLAMVFVAWQMVIGYKQGLAAPRACKFTLLGKRKKKPKTPTLFPLAHGPRGVSPWLAQRRKPGCGRAHLAPGRHIRERLFGDLRIALLASPACCRFPFGNWLPGFRRRRSRRPPHTERDGNCLALGVGGRHSVDCGGGSCGGLYRRGAVSLF